MIILFISDPAVFATTQRKLNIFRKKNILSIFSANPVYRTHIDRKILSIAKILPDCVFGKLKNKKKLNNPKVFL